jgi:hypothetical protein
MVDSVALLLVSGTAAGTQSQYRTILILPADFALVQAIPPDYTRIVTHTFVRPWEVTITVPPFGTFSKIFFLSRIHAVDGFSILGTSGILV